ncbi:FAD-binding monooxygenase [Cellulomonas edaphi]|uniref:FAD-binding monooxygenase n=1 Tax=Cellulomonas edaphi TaxID=3053468 RepID=A0ABT7S611_9CELL|nr:FAD-binding monooxygenase [Cellulomons edaphi]MDM7831060.1 FAD-binding monooxygenase [Cellulomons edaphi]
MQFHHQGYVSGDPRIQPVAGVGLDRPDELPDEVDVLVVGTGPAGMIAAAQLSQFPDVTTRIVDRRPGRLEIGQADGIQPRSVETFAAFGFAGRIAEESYRVMEVCFWHPDPADPARIVRGERTPDDPTGISEFPHLYVNQARVLDYFAEFMANSPTRMTPDYGYEFRDLEIAPSGEHPVTVHLVRSSGDDAGSEKVVRARYVLGADGAHSGVRRAIGCTPVGVSAAHAWGVMDVLAVTDFPDIRRKCAIQSGSGGSILLIPREGGHLFRMYVDLGEVQPEGHGAVRSTTIAQIVARANEILHPYTLDVKEVTWHSVYEVGHRITDRFDDVPTDQAGERTPRVFIAGDACHTHSAKAGQGMNVSMQDGLNLGWKLGYVLSGRSPESLLSTYSAERQVIAQDLIDFDRQWSSLMAKKPDEFEDPAELADFYVRTTEFLFGFMTQYSPSMLVAEPVHQALATGFPVGRRFKSAPVVRVADANPLHLGHQHRADGRWRVYAFADGAPAGPGTALADWADWMASSPDSPVRAHTPEGADVDAVLDVKVVYQQRHTDVELSAVPSLFLPRTGPLRLVDYEKVFAVDPTADIFALRGIDRGGCVVLVRPDQYVAAVLPLAATEELAAFFRGHLLVRDRQPVG